MTEYLNPPRSGRGYMPLTHAALDAMRDVPNPVAAMLGNEVLKARARGGNRFTGLSKGRTKVRGQMNRNEANYAAHLDARQAAGEIVRYWFEPFSLRLSSPPTGQPARYTPDFLILMPDGLTIVDDVKNANIDDKAAIVRIKAAAELYPLWVFRLVRPIAKKRGGGWDVKEV